MKGRLARFLYSLLLRLATPVYLARLWWRGRREPLYRTKWGERLGLGLQRAEPGALWVHAVSLGETRAAAALVHLLRERRPQLRLLLTHTTATGREAGIALLREGDLQAWLPYDTPGAVRRFLAAHRPAVGVLMETEIWPNLLHEASRAGVPMVLANARLSARSQRKGERFAALLHPAAARLRSVMAQTEGDAQRLRASGAGPVQVMGNLKFDMVMDVALIERGHAWRRIADRPTVLMASSREGEEVPLLAAWAALPGTRPLLLLVPRHPQRFDEVAALVAAAGLRCERRSSWGDTPPHHAAPADVWLGDSMREMALYYAAADVALLGGSFEPLGGQNLIEAAACGCPLLMGPHTFNFELAAELAIEAGAAQRVPDLQQAVPRAAELASDAAERSAWSARARAFAAAHRGAAARMADEVLRVAGTALR